MNTHTYRVSALDLTTASRALWSALQAQDGHLPDLSQPGCGELTGGHLRVRFIQDVEGALFACEVVDLQEGLVWDAAFARPDSATFTTYWRSSRPDVATPPRPWTEATETLHLEPSVPKHQPTFLALAAAYFSSPGAFALVENVSSRAAVDDELAYWRETARAQARVIRQLQSEQAPRAQHHHHQPHTPPEAAPSMKDWALKDIGAWAALHSEKIVVLPRAVAAARKSSFEDAPLLYAALRILAETYPAVKRGEAGREQAKQELAAIGVSIGGSVDPGRAGAFGDEYFVNWRGRRRFLDQHLAKGSSRDPRYTLRIYFTWDEEIEQVIVGWLPSHLANSLT